jgi:hypothetical protein
MFDAAGFKRDAYADLGEPVTPAAGAAFVGMLKVADRDAFTVAQVGDYTLRYPATAASLQLHDRLTIGGVPYQVAEHPRRIGDGHECQVALMEARD